MNRWHARPIYATPDPEPESLPRLLMAVVGLVIFAATWYSLVVGLAS